MYNITYLPHSIRFGMKTCDDDGSTSQTMVPVRELAIKKITSPQQSLQPQLPGYRVQSLRDGREHGKNLKTHHFTSPFPLPRVWTGDSEVEVN